MWATLIGDVVKQADKNHKENKNMELYRRVKQFHELCKKQDSDVIEVY